MNDLEVLAGRFDAHRGDLRAVAVRMLGSSQEADDAVQEALLRLSRTDADAVDNLGGLPDDRGGSGLPEHASGALRAAGGSIRALS